MGRPLGVAVLAVVAFLIGIVEIMRSFLTFGSPVLAYPLGFDFPRGFAFPLYLVLGLVWIFVSYSFWKGAEIGWILGIVMALLIAVLNYPLGTVLGVFVLAYLVIPKGVRSWFSKPGIRKWMGA